MTALATTRERLLVAQEGRNEILLCTHFQPDQGLHVVSAFSMDAIASIHSMVLGGREHDKLLVSSTDGKRILLYLTPTEETGSSVTEVVSEAHTAEVTGSCPGIGKGEVVTCSGDGRLCIWDCVSQTCAYKRTFTARFSAVTSFPQLRLIVVGSKAGVIRIVHGGQGLPVIFRNRISHQPITHAVSAIDSRAGILTFISGATVFLSRVEQTGLLSGLKALDTVGVPTALAFTHPISGLRLLIGFVECELACLDVEDCLTPQGPFIPERRVRVHAPITAMCCVEPSSQSSIGRICAVFLDHVLRCGDLPADASAWTTAKGRGMRLQDMCEIDSRVIGARLTGIPSCDGDRVAVASPTGSIWSAIVGSKGKAACVHVGDAAGRGVSTIASNSLGTMLVAGCEDGCIIFCEAGDQDKGAGIEGMKQMISDQAALKVDKDMADDHDETVQHAQQPAEALSVAMSSTAMQTSVEQNTIMFKLTLLREKLQDVLQRNAQASTLDQVARNDLIIHIDLASTLRQIGKVRVDKLRHNLWCSAVCIEIVGWRIKAECEAGMMAQQKALTGIRVPVAVHSYPQRILSKEKYDITHVRFLQAVEAAEWSSTGRTGMAAALNAQAAPDWQTQQSKAEDETVPSSANLLDGSCCLYSEWDLTTVKRRTISMRVLEGQVLQHQSAFNAQMEQIAKRRREAEDSLQEQYQRLEEAAAELHSMGLCPSPEDCKPGQV